MRLHPFTTTVLSCLPLICPAQENAQQDIIPYVSRIDVWAEDSVLELRVGSVSNNKLYLCEVEDLVISDSKGNVLTAFLDQYLDAHIYEFVPDHSLGIRLFIKDRIRGARISVSGTLVMESVPAQNLATVYIPLQLDAPATHRVGEQELYIRGEERLPRQEGARLYNSIRIAAKSDSTSRIQQLRWWKKGSSAADVAEEISCHLVSLSHGSDKMENTLATEEPVNTCTLEVKYWPKGETVRVPFHFNVSLNKAESVQP